MTQGPVAGQNIVNFNNSDWTGESGLSDISLVVHVGNENPEPLQPVTEQEIAVRALGKVELVDKTTRNEMPDYRKLGRQKIIDSFGELEKQETAGNLSLSVHKSGWVRIRGPQLPSGAVIPLSVQAEIVSDPDVGLRVSELGFEHPKITKKVFEEYGPLLIAHTIGLIGRPAARGVDGFDATVVEGGKELPVTIKTLPTHSSLLQPENGMRYTKAFYKLITPMKGDSESLALLVPIDTIDSDRLSLLIANMQREGIDPARVRILDGNLLDPAGLVTSSHQKYPKPERVSYSGIGLFRIAAALEANPIFNDFVAGKDDGPFTGNFRIALRVAQLIRSAKSKAQTLSTIPNQPG